MHSFGGSHLRRPAEYSNVHDSREASQFKFTVWHKLGLSKHINAMCCFTTDSVSIDYHWFAAILCEKIFCLCKQLDGRSNKCFVCPNRATISHILQKRALAKRHIPGCAISMFSVWRCPQEGLNEATFERVRAGFVTCFVT